MLRRRVLHLLKVLMRRYENRSTIMTSNRPLEEWGKLLGDAPTAGASWIVSFTTPRPLPSPGEATGLKIARRHCNRVAIQGTNTMDVVVALPACFHAGLVAVPVNTRFKPPEIQYVLDHSRS